jgi:hypothetical protein
VTIVSRKKMSSHHRKGAAEEVEDAAFAMERELEEAKAAVKDLPQEGEKGWVGGSTTSGQAHDGERARHP